MTTTQPHTPRRSRSLSLTALLLSAAACLAACSARASGQGITYHLRPGSTDQEGCFRGGDAGGMCACMLLPPEDMRGTMTLTPVLAGPGISRFSISNVHFAVPTLGRTFAGSGLYEFSVLSPGMRQMSLTMTFTGPTDPAGPQGPLEWSTGNRAFNPPIPPEVIDVTLSFPTECYNMELTLKATPLASDWNADGATAPADLFDFLNSWFTGDGDADHNGSTNVADVFTFVNDWFDRS